MVDLTLIFVAFAYFGWQFFRINSWYLHFIREIPISFVWYRCICTIFVKLTICTEFILFDEVVLFTSLIFSNYNHFFFDVAFGFTSLFLQFISLIYVKQSMCVLLFFVWCLGTSTRTKKTQTHCAILIMSPIWFTFFSKTKTLPIYVYKHEKSFTIHTEKTHNLHQIICHWRFGSRRKKRVYLFILLVKCLMVFHTSIFIKNDMGTADTNNSRGECDHVCLIYLCALLFAWRNDAASISSRIQYESRQIVWIIAYAFNIQLMHLRNRT